MLGIFGMSYANNVISEDKLSVYAFCDGEEEKSGEGSSISAYINGNVLTVVFPRSLGEVMVEVATIEGSSVYYSLIQTPTGYQIYIPSTGNFSVTFTLQNGNMYYAEFEVEE